MFEPSLTPTTPQPTQAPSYTPTPAPSAWPLPVPTQMPAPKPSVLPVPAPSPMPTDVTCIDGRLNGDETGARSLAHASCSMAESI
jgi:hypothetical protein